jgi:hypothetical protein
MRSHLLILSIAATLAAGQPGSQYIACGSDDEGEGTS